ncbi:MAG: TetR/AcrR family transcriptional regulator, partial [Oscillospiraceae bacterium]
MTGINPERTSKEEILQISRKIAAEKGLKALNMRAVAGECGIALGTLYNYFSDKEELLIATISSLWQDLFQLSPRENRGNPLFAEYVETLFKSVRERISEYPDFFTTHSAVITNSGKNRALNAMERCTDEIRGTLLTVLREDSLVAADAFSEKLTEVSFVEFVLDSIIMLLMQNK